MKNELWKQYEQEAREKLKQVASDILCYSQTFILLTIEFLFESL